MAHHQAFVASESEVVQEATSLFAACYGINKSTTMPGVCRIVWKDKTSGEWCAFFKLHSDSVVSFNHNAKRSLNTKSKRVFGDTRLN